METKNPGVMAICHNPGELSSVPNQENLLQQAAAKDLARFVEEGLPLDLRAHVFEAIAQFFERIKRHVRAFVAGAGDPRNPMVVVLGETLLQLPHHVRFRGDQKVGRFREGSDFSDHRFGPTCEIAVGKDVGRALGVGQGDGFGHLLFHGDQVAHAEDFVDHAGAVPENHFAPGDLLEVVPQVAIGDEEDFILFGNTTDDLFGVAAGYDPIGKRLHFGGGVDVGDGLELAPIDAEHFLIAGEFVRRAAIRKAAPGFHVGQEYDLFGIEDLGRLGHEMDATENDHRGLDLGGRAGQSQTVACIVGDFLDFPLLVVVGKNGRAFFFFQPQDVRYHLIHDNCPKSVEVRAGP